MSKAIDWKRKNSLLVLVDFFMNKPDGRYLIMKDPMKVRALDFDWEFPLVFFCCLGCSSSKMIGCAFRSKEICFLFVYRFIAYRKLHLIAKKTAVMTMRMINKQKNKILFFLSLSLFFLSENHSISVSSLSKGKRHF